MRFKSVLVLASRMLTRDYRAGELWGLISALTIAVASVTTVAFLTDAIKRDLSERGSQLLGADLVVVSDQPFTADFERVARNLRLETTVTAKFPSMVSYGEQALLSEVRAVGKLYPLKGQLKLADGRVASLPRELPGPGSTWVDESMAAKFGVRPGDFIRLGQRNFVVQGIIVEEPDTAVSLMRLGPRLLINFEDLASTQLIQTGSRVSYRLMVAGELRSLKTFQEFVVSHLQAGQRVEGLGDARPEIKTLLDRTHKILGLAALVSVALASVAIVLSCRRYLQRHLDSCAMMRCVGANQKRILGIYLVQFTLLGLGASLLGCGLGALGYTVLASVLQPILNLELSTPGFAPVAIGCVTGVLLLFSFALPPLISLSQIPSLRVLRRDLGVPRRSGIFAYALGIGTISGLILYQANEVKLGLYVLGGFIGVILVSILMSLGILELTARIGGRAQHAWRFGLLALKRRSLSNVIQIASLGLGLMAILVLSLVREDLMRNWNASLPKDTPNYFLVNIQADEMTPLAEYFKANNLVEPKLLPMVRGRLAAINEKPVSANDYADDRAKRLIDREFNLSWSEQLQTDNVITAGRVWGPEDRGKALLSVEEGIASTLGIQLGDALTYEVAGQRFTAHVVNLRKVEWDSFRVNFFVIAQPGLLENYPTSYVTSFYLPQDHANVMSKLVKRFPGFLVIDVAAIVSQVQNIMTIMARAVEWVFLFTAGASLVVLYVALDATKHERWSDIAIMRTLGARRSQLVITLLTEFVAIGALAGLFAASAATILAYLLATQVFDIVYSFNPWVWVIAITCGAGGIALTGWFVTRATLDRPPLQTLRAVA